MAKSLLWPFLLLVGGHIVLGFDFEDAHTGGVEWIEATVNTLKLTMDENNQEGTLLVYLSNAQSQPTYVFSDGDQNLLGLSIDLLEAPHKYGVFVSKSVDYEEASRFTITFREAGQSDKALLLLINNLDDNAPTLYPSGLCKIPENTEITAVTSPCVFTVEDPDGWLSSIAFNIEKPEESLFAFDYRDPKPSDYDTRAEVYLILQKGQVLDIEENTLYILQVQVQDQGGNALSPVQVIVQVVDMPDMPPIFTRIDTPPRLFEETEASFSVEARDGDYGINNPIKYKIESSVAEGLIQIDESTGEIYVGRIDRDADNINSITFVVVAYEEPDPNSIATLPITLILDDIDDELPLFQDDNTLFANIILPENWNKLVIPGDIRINDKDLGRNAMFTVKLQPVDGHHDFTSAFEIFPNHGIGENDFILSVKDPSKLDFEDPIWGQGNIITFKIVSEGTENPSNADYRVVTIVLEDVNEEFSKESDSSSFDDLESSENDEELWSMEEDHYKMR